MKKDLANIIIYYIYGLLIIIIMSTSYELSYLYGEYNLTQKLCTQKQYDFCEVIKQKTEYRLKELKQDE